LKQGVKTLKFVKFGLKEGENWFMLMRQSVMECLDGRIDVALLEARQVADMSVALSFY